MESGRHPSATALAGTAGCVVLLVVHAWSYRFVCDDAFISFRYAENLVLHGELSYNLGAAVEGYSNFLWTLAIALGLWLGAEPVLWSQVLGLGSAVLTLLSVVRFSTLRSGTFSVADALPALFLGAAPGFAAWSTGGLETQAFTLFVTLGWTTFLGPRRPLRAGLYFGLSALTRPEGLFFFVAICAYQLGGGQRWTPRPGDTEDSRGQESATWSAIRATAAGFAALYVPFLMWRYLTYGQWLPNTFYAKGASLELVGPGLHYLKLWILENALYVIPVLMWPLVRPSSLALGAREVAGLALVYAVGHCAYVVAVGGDFMVLGRYLVPLMPLLALVAAQGARELLGRHLKRSAALPVALLLSTLAGYGALQVRADALEKKTTKGLASIGWLLEFVEQGQAIGRWLREKAPEETRMAITAAGTIPFYSRLWTLDLLGLNDAWIAHNVPPSGSRPGHRKRAPLSYVLDSKMDYVINHPTMTTSPSWPSRLEQEQWAQVGYSWQRQRIPGLKPPWLGFWALTESSRGQGR